MNLTRPSLPSDEEVHWHGLSKDLMIAFSEYVNDQEPGICGSYSLAAFLDVLDRLKGEEGMSFEERLQALVPLVERKFPYSGTFAWDILKGLKEFLPKNCHSGLHWSFNPHLAAKRCLDGPVVLPIILGTSWLQGSPYGNHWVLAYAYKKEEEGIVFSCYDNHGNSEALIPSAEVLTAIWLDPSSFVNRASVLK